MLGKNSYLQCESDQFTPVGFIWSNSSVETISTNYIFIMSRNNVVLYFLSFIYNLEGISWASFSMCSFMMSIRFSGLTWPCESSMLQDNLQWTGLVKPILFFNFPDSSKLYSSLVPDPVTGYRLSPEKIKIEWSVSRISYERESIISSTNCATPLSTYDNSEGAFPFRKTKKSRSCLQHCLLHLHILTT